MEISTSMVKLTKQEIPTGSQNAKMSYRKGKLPLAQKLEVIKEHECGKTIMEIAHAHGINESSVRWILKRRGLFEAMETSDSIVTVTKPEINPKLSCRKQKHTLEKKLAVIKELPMFKRQDQYEAEAMGTLTPVVKLTKLEMHNETRNPKMNPRKRKFLALAQKLEVLKEHKSGKTNAQIVRSLGIHESSVRWILKHQSQYAAMDATGSVMKLTDQDINTEKRNPKLCYQNRKHPLEKKLQVIKEHKSGKTNAQIVRSLGIHESSVRRILKHQSQYAAMDTTGSVLKLTNQDINTEKGNPKLCYRNRKHPLEKKLQVIKEHKNGKKNFEIARSHGINESTVRSILKRQDKYEAEAKKTNTSVIKLSEKEIPNPEMSFKQQKLLILEEKLEVIKENKSGQKNTEIAHAHTISESSVCSKLKRQDQYEAEAMETSTSFVKLTTEIKNTIISDMEPLLLSWIEDCNKKRIPLSEKNVKDKALNLYQRLKEQGKIDTSKNFTASSGWFRRFKKRSNLHNTSFKKLKSNEAEQISSPLECKDELYELQERIGMQSGEIKQITSNLEDEFDELVKEKMSGAFRSMIKKEILKYLQSHGLLNDTEQSEIVILNPSDPELKVKEEPMDFEEEVDVRSMILLNGAHEPEDISLISVYTSNLSSFNNEISSSRVEENGKRKVSAAEEIERNEQNKFSGNSTHLKVKSLKKQNSLQSADFSSSSAVVSSRRTRKPNSKYFSNDIVS